MTAKAIAEPSHNHAPVPAVVPDGPGLCIMLLTYDRMEYAKITLNAVMSKLKYTRGRVRIHIATDGDTDEYMNELLALADGYVDNPTKSNAHRRGYGANYNLATQVIHQMDVKYVLPLEDDWECLRELDADTFTLALDSGKFACVRLGYLGYTQRLDGSVVAADGGHYLLLNPHSPEPHVFAGHPRIETVAWEREVGPWVEGIKAGSTEFEVAHRFEARNGVAWPMSVDPRDGYGVFAHIGSEKAADIV